jgi:hypothetical protein
MNDYESSNRFIVDYIVDQVIESFEEKHFREELREAARSWLSNYFSTYNRESTEVHDPCEDLHDYLLDLCNKKESEYMELS